MSYHHQHGQSLSTRNYETNGDVANMSVQRPKQSSKLALTSTISSATESSSMLRFTEQRKRNLRWPDESLTSIGDGN